MTRPFFTVLESTRLIRPTRQPQVVSVLLAALKVSPLTAGTTQVLKKLALTDLEALIVSVHAPLPAQAPDQPANLEPLAVEAFKVTRAPLG